MSDVSKQDVQGEPDSWDTARTENLLAFARTTPEQKLQWLWDMLIVVTDIRGQIDSQTGKTDEPTNSHGSIPR